MKTCKKCGRELPETEFYKLKGGKDGLRAQCKSCFTQPKEVKVVMDDHNPLASFTPRQLMTELFRRGYRGELEVIQGLT